MSGQRAFIAALLDPQEPPPAGLKAWNGSDPAARFAVYRNNVVVSLIDALADTYPVTQELVGEPFFRAMARLFVVAAPPRSRVLAFYGEAFPGFIEGFPPAAPVPYLADVARLEMARVRAYHAADAAGLGADAMAQRLADADAGPDLVIGFQHSAALIRSRYAVASLWEAHRGAADISDVDPYLPEQVLVVRVGLDVASIRLSAGAAEFVAQLIQGERLGAAVERAADADAGFHLADTLSVLMRARAITSMNTTRRLNS